MSSIQIIILKTNKAGTKIKEINKFQ